MLKLIVKQQVSELTDRSLHNVTLLRSLQDLEESRPNHKEQEQTQHTRPNWHLVILRFLDVTNISKGDETCLLCRSF